MLPCDQTFFLSAISRRYLYDRIFVSWNWNASNVVLLQVPKRIPRKHSTKGKVKTNLTKSQRGIYLIILSCDQQSPDESLVVFNRVSLGRIYSGAAGFQFCALQVYCNLAIDSDRGRDTILVSQYGMVTILKMEFKWKHCIIEQVYFIILFFFFFFAFLA